MLHTALSRHSLGSLVEGVVKLTKWKILLMACMSLLSMVLRRAMVTQGLVLPASMVKNSAHQSLDSFSR